MNSDKHIAQLKGEVAMAQTRATAAEVSFASHTKTIIRLTAENYKLQTAYNAAMHLLRSQVPVTGTGSTINPDKT